MTLNTQLVNHRRDKNPHPELEATLRQAIADAAGVGPAGPPGPTGPAGPMGPAGPTVQQTYTQGTPAATWNVTHSMPHVPMVQVVDSGGTQVYGQVQHTSPTTLSIFFGAAFAGTAYLT